MAGGHRSGPSTPILFLLLTVAAVGGGLVSRMIPGGPADDTAPVARAPIAGATGGANAQTVSPLVQATAPAVVNIAVTQPSPAQQNPLLQDPFFRRYMGVPDSALQPAISSGSGVIVDSARGLVVTNYHVVRNATAVEVGLKDGRKLQAEPVGFAPNLDLAVLRIRASDLPQLKLGDSSKLAVGDYVLAIGNPFGLGQTVTAGIVSATDRGLSEGDPRRFVQTDAPINPGNSGGALINSKGEVIGINSALISPNREGGNVGIGFAIPSNVVREIVEQAVKGGPPR